MNDKTTSTEEKTTISTPNASETSSAQPEHTIGASVLFDSDFAFCPYGRCYTD